MHCHAMERHERTRVGVGHRSGGSCGVEACPRQPEGPVVRMPWIRLKYEQTSSAHCTRLPAAAYPLRYFMKRPFFHRVIAVICLIVTGFHAAVGALVVQCEEANGTSHLEWGGCGKDETGRCVKPCSGEEPADRESDPANSCHDKPVKPDVGAARAGAAASVIAIDLPLPVFAILALSVDPLPANVLVRRVDARALAPPPEMACIRSIVMLV